ncbi:MAG: radical SAM protein [Candidatus Omnitrophota bacterium]
MTLSEEQGTGKTEDTPPFLTSLYINPTKFCNLSCRHCWVAPPYKAKITDGDDGELSMGEIIDVVRSAMEVGLCSVKLTGGEPLLREDLEQLLEFCARSGIDVLIETNGTLITRKTAKMFAEYGVSHISVSLDSACEEIHDFFRGHKGAYKRALKGIENLMEEYRAPQIIMSLYKESLDGFEDFLRLMARLGISEVKLNTITPVGRGGEMLSRKDLPGIKEILEFSKDLTSRVPECYGGEVYLDLPLAFKKLGEIKNNSCFFCKLKNILGLLSDGSVSICGIAYMDKDLIFGNVKGNPDMISHIWRNNYLLRKIREDIPARLEGVCGICVFKKYCQGACRAEAYYRSKSLTAPLWFCQEAYNQGLFPATRLIPEELRAKL